MPLIMRKILYATLCCLFSFGGVYAQSDKEEDAPVVHEHPVSVSLHIGSEGAGGDVKMRVAQRWFVRLGASTLPLDYGNVITLADYSSSFNLNTSFTNVHAFGEWQPFGRLSLRVVGGVAYFVSGKISGTLMPEGTFSYNGVTVTAAQIGQINCTVDWKGVAPYLGIGLWKGIPVRHRFGVNMDLGTYYMSKPNTVVTGTNMLNSSNNTDNSKQLNQELAGYRWLPVLQVNFSYRIL